MKRPLKVHRGQILRHRGPLELCKKGLHASIKPLDALKYAPGSVVCRVECSGEVIYGEDKLVCSRRRVLWIEDASRVLCEYATWCIFENLEAEYSDPRNLGSGARNKAIHDAIRYHHTARETAWVTAWHAARENQNEELERRLLALQPH